MAPSTPMPSAQTRIAIPDTVTTDRRAMMVPSATTRLSPASWSSVASDIEVRGTSASDSRKEAESALRKKDRPLWRSGSASTAAATLATRHTPRARVRPSDTLSFFAMTRYWAPRSALKTGMMLSREANRTQTANAPRPSGSRLQARRLWPSTPNACTPTEVVNTTAISCPAVVFGGDAVATGSDGVAVAALRCRGLGAKSRRLRGTVSACVSSIRAAGPGPRGRGQSGQRPVDGEVERGQQRAGEPR